MFTFGHFHFWYSNFPLMAISEQHNKNHCITYAIEKWLEVSNPHLKKLKVTRGEILFRKKEVYKNIFSNHILQ